MITTQEVLILRKAEIPREQVSERRQMTKGREKPPDLILRDTYLMTETSSVLQEWSKHLKLYSKVEGPKQFTALALTDISLNQPILLNKRAEKTN